MKQGDFLIKMKSWIKRKCLLQSVVYTESMKSEIEAIGQAIHKGNQRRFPTETSLHQKSAEIYLGYSMKQTKQVASLDNILDKTFGGYAIGTNNALSGLHLVGEAGSRACKISGWGGEQVLNAK